MGEWITGGLGSAIREGEVGSLLLLLLLLLLLRFVSLFLYSLFSSIVDSVLCFASGLVSFDGL